MLTDIQSIPLSLYIHFPWCESRCHYCDFNAHQKPTILPEQDYLLALKKELKNIAFLREKLGDPRKHLHSIFIGGGTPSLISVNLIGKLINQINQYFDLSDAEISLEANPSSSDSDKFACLRKIGVNRLSIGVQSFNSNLLKKLSRAHSGQTAQKALEIASKYFDNINIDLMYGIEGQSTTDAMSDLQMIDNYPINHLSYYQLNIEANTYFYHHPPKIPQESVLTKIENQAYCYLEQIGFKRYEISAFAKKNFNCKHNLNYWQFGDYWAIGAGAAAKISLNKNNQFNYFRSQNPKHPKTYFAWIKNGAAIKMQFANEQNKMFEFILNATRLITGFDANLFSSRTGLDFSLILNKVQKLKDENLITIVEGKNNQVYPTDKGFNFLNEIHQHFLPKI